MEQQFFNNMSEKVVDDLRKTVVAGSRLSIAAASFSLLSILNSNIAKLWIWYNCPEFMGGTREIRKAYFENLRIPLDNAELLKQFASLANEIISAKTADPNADIPALEKQVDQKVYELYGMSDEKIGTEEGKGNIFNVMV